MKMFNYVKDKITGFAHPSAYPSDEKSDEWTIPDPIKNDYSKLNAVIEAKYTREFLKICAFYNKLFPSLKGSNWTRSFYNVQPFTTLDQERDDTGTGISQNFLKQITDGIVSRLGTISFEAAVLADVPTLEYVMYKDEVERILRKQIRDQDLNQMTLEMFHNAAILGYAHALIDPFTHKWLKASDFELGFFEAQFNKGAIRQLLYRDYAFPVTELPIYLDHCEMETKEKVIENVGTKNTVDFKLYIDAVRHEVYVTIGGITLEPIPYPFDQVQMVTFQWDTGFSKVTTTSLFDLLYPCQRELNKVNAKIQQLVRMYKGPVPVFNSDVDLAMKQITNSTGEALYVDSARPVDQLMTTINPTPLDPQLDALITGYKTQMMELAGVQQISFDMENMRSAAAVIALDQTRDNVFQAQMMGHAKMKADMFKVEANYKSVIMPEDDTGVEWKVITKLLSDGIIELKPIHLNDPLGNKGSIADQPKTDFRQMQTARFVNRVLRGDASYGMLSYVNDREMITAMLAGIFVKLDAMSIPIPDHAYVFMLEAFLEDIKLGTVQLPQPPQLDVLEGSGSQLASAEGSTMEQQPSSQEAPVNG
jgi:hypothetical protein